MINRTFSDELGRSTPLLSKSLLNIVVLRTKSLDDLYICTAWDSKYQIPMQPMAHLLFSAVYGLLALIDVARLDQIPGLLIALGIHDVGLVVLLGLTCDTLFIQFRGAAV